MSSELAVSRQTHHDDASRTREVAAALLLLRLVPSLPPPCSPPPFHRHNRGTNPAEGMQTVRTLVLQHLRLRAQPYVATAAHGGGGRAAVAQCGFARGMNAPASEEDGEPGSQSAIRARVVDLVKKFDKIDADKVTETADFQKDLSLDSLDRVELVMAFEQEFSIEIPDDKADKLSCCADVAKYIISESQSTSNDASSS